MSLPRGRVFTLSPYQPRPVLPVSVHRGDILDVTVNWARLLRTGETPNETLNAANVSGRGVSITNISYEGKYLSFTVSGAQSNGLAGISMAISTTRGRTLSRSLAVRTVWEEAVIDPVVEEEEPPLEENCPATINDPAYVITSAGPIAALDGAHGYADAEIAGSTFGALDDNTFHMGGFQIYGIIAFDDAGTNYLRVILHSDTFGTLNNPRATVYGYDCELYGDSEEISIGEDNYTAWTFTLLNAETLPYLEGAGSKTIRLSAQYLG